MHRGRYGREAASAANKLLPCLQGRRAAQHCQRRSKRSAFLEPERPRRQLIPCCFRPQPTRHRQHQRLWGLQGLRWMHLYRASLPSRLHHRCHHRMAPQNLLLQAALGTSLQWAVVVRRVWLRGVYRGVRQGLRALESTRSRATAAVSPKGPCRQWLPHRCCRAQATAAVLVRFGPQHPGGHPRLAPRQHTGDSWSIDMHAMLPS